MYNAKVLKLKNKIIHELNSCRYFFFRYRNNQRKIREISQFLSSGRWIMESRFAYNENAKKNFFVKLFYHIVYKKPSYLSKLIFLFTGYKTLKIKNYNHINASIFYLTREGGFKLFDFEKNKIYTEIDIQKSKLVLNSQISPISSYFEIPKQKIDYINNEQFLIEELIYADNLFKIDDDKKPFVYSELINLYSKYIVECGEYGDLEIATSVFNEVSNKMLSLGNYDVEKKRNDYINFIKKVKFVEAHLDFNIANVLYDGGFYILDNNALGVKMPGFYDVINIAFNEINYRNEYEWLSILTSRAVMPIFVKMMKKCNKDFQNEDFEMVLFTYSVFQNSTLVTNALGQEEKKPKQLVNVFKKLGKLKF